MERVIESAAASFEKQHKRLRMAGHLPGRIALGRAFR